MFGRDYDIKTISGLNGVSSAIRGSMGRAEVQATRFMIDGRKLKKIQGGLTEELFLNEMARAGRNGYIPNEVIVILGNGQIKTWPKDFPGAPF